MNQITPSTPTVAAAIERASLGDSVYESLLEAILAGRLPGGAEMNAVALAKQLDVSRTPVHEAIRRLVSDGLVEQENWRKARVAQHTREDVENIYEQRALLEGEAAYRAATRMTDEQLAQMRAETETLVDKVADIDWPAHAIHFDLHFHDCLAKASGNRALAADIRRYRLLVRGLCRITGTRENLQVALAEHLQILTSLELHDPEGARRAMVEHIQLRLAKVLQTVYL